jgi:hypothetical protein
MMRLLLVGGGASFSTKDVETGYYKALRLAGHDVGLYLLDKRLGLAKSYLQHHWLQVGKPEGTKPTSDDIAYMAAEEICQRACYHQPEWVVFLAGRMTHPSVWVALKHAGIKTALIATEAPYDDEWLVQVAPLFDVMFVNERASVEGIKAANPHTHYLGPSYDPDIHKPGGFGAEAEAQVPEHDVVFVGSNFSERARILQAVDWFGVDLGLYGNWRTLGSRSVLRGYVYGGIVDNFVAAALYRKASIGLNLYRWGKGWAKNAPPVERAESLNPRAVELAACGVFTISDYRAEVAEIFGAAVPTFRTPAELQELVTYYLDHDDERQAKAARLPGLIAGHTFGARAATLTATLEGHS